MAGESIVSPSERIEVGSELPRIPPGPVTHESLEAEAAGLGDGFTEVTWHAADLVADAEEILEGRADLEEFIEREYAVTADHFDRVELLKDVLAPAKAEGEVIAKASQKLTENADAALKTLLTNRSTIAGIGKAAGLPESLFSLQTRNTTRLNVVAFRMEQVLANVVQFRARMPDKKKLDKLVVESRRILDEQKELRRRRDLMRVQRSLDTARAERYERLLLDILIYLSAQGQAAFGDDPSREGRYRLDHTYGRRSKVEPLAPETPASDVDVDAA